MEHDKTYKLLFSHAEMVEDLLRGFVPEEWVGQLDFATLEKYPGSYVSDNLDRREDDVVWRLRCGESWTYVYILIEFQSSVDYFMALRVMAYLALFYQDLVRSEKLVAGDRLPPVLPIVLYNGRPRWTAAQDIADLLSPAPKGLERYAPRLRYFLIDEGRYADSDLVPLKNLVAALFRLENSRTAREMDGVLAALVEWLKAPDQASLRRAFVAWLRQGLQSKLPGLEFTQLNDLYEVRSMLADRVDEWTEEWLRQGEARGVARRRQEGEATLLQRLLERRFGALDETVRLRIAEADADTLLRWGERIFQASSAEDVVRD